MSRMERRKVDRYKQKLNKEVKKLTPNQLKLIDEITEHKTNEALDLFKQLVTTAIFKSMRGNRISENRANKIIEETDRQLREWLEEEKEVS